MHATLSTMEAVFELIPPRASSSTHASLRPFNHYLSLQIGRRKDVTYLRILASIPDSDRLFFLQNGALIRKENFQVMGSRVSSTHGSIDCNDVFYYS